MKGAVDKLTTSDFNDFLWALALILKQDPPQLIYQEGILPNIKVKLHNPKTDETTKESQLILPVLETAIFQAVSEIFKVVDNAGLQATFINMLLAFWKKHNLQPLVIPSMFHSDELDLTMFFLMRIPLEWQSESITTWPEYFQSNIKHRVRTELNPTGFFLRYDTMCYQYAQILAATLLGLTKVHD